jgi:hypothetical protein
MAGIDVYEGKDSRDCVVLFADITLVLLNYESRVASCCDYTLCVVHTCDVDDDYDDHDDDD